MATEIKTLTLNDLKEFLNGLNEVQLRKFAFVHETDGISLPITGCFVTEEDHYLTDEGWSPVSTFEPDDTDPDDKLENYDIQPAGFPCLCSDS